ncbi:MAG: iron chelate uptake ABC transporter family permease subunit [Erysipelotrichales bacterium]|nr:iron chelate uptake ABC transporter family permease subunit [Erysipelotrichales bacterium]
MALLIILLITVSIVSLFVGVYRFSLFDLFLQNNVGESARTVLWHSRIPRTLAVLTAGIGLSIAGLIMQSLTNNKFVSPTTAGTLEGARLGIILSLLLIPAAGMFLMGIFAFVFTMLTTLVFILMLERIKIKNSTLVPLIGIIYGGIIGSVALFIAMQMDMVQNAVTLMIGDFSLVLSGHYEIIFLTIPLIIIAYIYANRFMIAGVGEDFAKNLGLNYRLTINIGLVIVAMITTLVLLVAGVIPFLGLIVPNIVTIFLGDNVKRTLPVTALAGGLFLLICDVLARLIIFPYEIPVSLVVGIIGAAIFIVLLIRGRKHAI